MFAKTKMGHFLLTGLILLAVIVRVKVSSEVAIAGDEFAYIPSGINYVQNLLKADFNASSYSENYEHPDFAKLLIGFSVYFLTGKSNFPSAYVPEILISARFAGIGTSLIAILAVFLFGRKVWGDGSLGLIASAILALDPLFIYYGSIAYLDVPSSAFAAMSITLFAIAWKEKSFWKAVGSAVFAGISMSSKYLGFFILPILVTWLCSIFLTDLWSKRRKYALLSGRLKIFSGLRALLRSRLVWAIIAYLPVAFLFFYLTDPYIWQDTFSHLKGSIQFSVTRSQTGIIKHIIFDHVSTNPPWYVWLVLLYTKTSEVQVILLTLGIPLLCLSVLKRQYGSLLLLLWFLIPLAFLSLNPVKLGNYIVMCIPQISLISARALQAIAKKLTSIPNLQLPRLPYKRFRWWRIESVVVITLFIHSALIMSFYPYLDLYHNHTVGTYTVYLLERSGGTQVAVMWVTENVPEGSVIASSLSSTFRFYAGDHFYRDIGLNLSRTIDELRGEGVSYVIVDMRWLIINRDEGSPLYKEILQLMPVYTVTLVGEPVVYIYKI